MRVGLIVLELWERCRAHGAWRRLIALLALAVTLGACSGDRLLGEHPIKLADAPRQAELSPAAQREHQRILAAYGGAYHDSRLEALVTTAVDRLVAASERPTCPTR